MPGLIHVVGLLALLGVSPALAEELVALCYHDVRDDVDGSLDSDQMAVHRDHLALHFAWLREQGYKPVGLDAIRSARAGEEPLPDRAVLLTFDDGYASFYREVFPLLRLYDFPAVLAVVTGWLEVPEDEQVMYGEEPKHRSSFVTWEQVREMQASGLVEIASHSHDKHGYIPVNPQGNTRPAMTSREFIREGVYESEADYLARVREDLLQSRWIIQERTGRAPSAIVWPYGEHNRAAWEAAKEVGYELSLVLGGERFTDTRDEHIGRQLILSNPDMAALANHFEEASWRTPVRVVHVDLDYAFDEDLEQQQRNIDKLIQRIHEYQVTTVYLQAYADPDGDGRVREVYFHNRHLPVRADLFSHVAWQLRTRAGVEVYAWMPVSGFSPPFEHEHWRVLRKGARGPELSDTHYERLSIFAPDAEAWIDDIYQDLGRYAWMDGVIFHDDGLLTDHEDLHPSAIRYYERNGFPNFDLDAIHANPDQHRRWAELKERALTDFTLRRAATLRAERPDLRTARNLYARTILQPESQLWFSQSLEGFTRAYDHTAVMAMPLMEGASRPRMWLRELASAVREADTGPGIIVFELQARDWRTGARIPGAVQAGQMKTLQYEGIINYGYYPDDFVSDEPALQEVRPELSVDDYPERRP